MSECASWHHPLQFPARAKRCWWKQFIGILNAEHGVPQCGVTNFHGEIQDLFPSCTGTTKATTWQTEWAVMAVNYVQSHWSCWIILSPNLRAVCKRLQQTLLGQLAMWVSDATTRLCEFWTYGSFNSASIWLIGIRRQFVLQLLSEIRFIYLDNKRVEAPFSSMRARYFGRSLVFLEWVNSSATPCWGNTAQCLGEKRWLSLLIGELARPLALQS